MIDAQNGISGRYPKLSFSCSILVGEVVWAAASNLNGLFIIHPESGVTEFVLRFEPYPWEAQSLFKKIIHHDGRLYLIPWYAEILAVYEISKKELHCYDLKEVHDAKWGKFAWTFIYKEILYMVPRWFLCGAMQEECTWLPLAEDHEVVKYNLNTGEYLLHCLSTEYDGAMDVLYREGVLYLLTRKGDVILWNPDTKTE